eukprot:UN22359
MYKLTCTAEEYNLASAFKWCKTSQCFRDQGSGFEYDIFLKCYTFNNRYFQYNYEINNYYEISNPLVHLNKKENPKTHGLPSSYRFNINANCFYSKPHKIYYDPKSKSYYHNKVYYEFDETMGNFVKPMLPYNWKVRLKTYQI